MPKLNINRSITIEAPADKIFKVLNHFETWSPWSPWLIMEPEATVDVREDGKFYSWQGKRIGEGQMAITNEVENKSIDYDLEFLKPWKSKAKVRFEFAEDGEQTKVTWYMDSALPFFLFWMKKMTTAYISMDYDRGLNMLKDYVENGTVPSKIGFDGDTNFPGYKYVGVKTTCSMEDIGPKMGTDFGKLNKWFSDHGIQPADVPFSMYHKWDMVNKKVEYTSGFPVKDYPENLSGDFVKGEIPQLKTYSLTHTGPYRHLGNAWSTGYNMHQSKAFKMNKSVAAFETYPSDPAKVAEDDIVTKIYFPIK